MFVMAAVAAGTLMACGGKGKSGGGRAITTTAPRTLYDRLGGRDAIIAVVEDFIGNVSSDNRISAFFQHADLPGLKQKLVDQICETTGGPCKYTGKDMKTAHDSMGVKDADFTALVDDLVKTLDKFKVGDKEKSDLLGALGAMKRDIVTAP